MTDDLGPDPITREDTPMPPRFLTTREIVREHILTVLAQAEAEGTAPADLWAAIVESPHYDDATRTLRPRISEDGIVEGSEGAPAGLVYEWQEPTAEWGEFIANGDHFRRGPDGWDYRR